MAWGTVELEPEVREWLERLPTTQFATAAFIILLTVFHKTRMREEREIDRARRALARCVAEEHTAEDEE